MKKLLIAFLFTISVVSFVNAQKIFSCENRYDADFKVYVVKNRYDADLLVFKVSNRYDVDTDGRWYFVENRYDADKKIWFAENRYDADLLIFIVENRYDAGWRNRSKMHLVFWLRISDCGFKYKRTGNTAKGRRTLRRDGGRWKGTGDTEKGRGTSVFALTPVFISIWKGGKKKSNKEYPALNFQGLMQNF